MIIFNKEDSILKYKYTLLANAAFSAVEDKNIKNKKLKSFLKQNETEIIKRKNNKGEEKELNIEECLIADIEDLRNYFSHYYHKVVKISKDAQNKIYNKLYDNACAGMFGSSLTSSPPPLFDDNGVVTREGAIFIFSLTADKSLVSEAITRNYEKEIDKKTKTNTKTKKTKEEEFFFEVIKKYTMKDSHSILDNEDENTKKAFVIKSFLNNLKKDLEKEKQTYVPQNIFFNNVCDYIVDAGLLPNEYQFFTIEDKKLLENKKREKNQKEKKLEGIIITEEDKTKVYFKNNNVFIVKKDDLENLKKIAHKKEADLQGEEKKQKKKFKYITISRTMLNRLMRAKFNDRKDFSFNRYFGMLKDELEGKKEDIQKKEVNTEKRLDYIIKKQKVYISEEKTTKNQKIDIILKYVNHNLPKDEKLGKEQYHKLFNSLVATKYISEDFITEINNLTNNKLDEKAKQVIREKKDDFMALFKKIVNKSKKDLERLKNKEKLTEKEKEYIGIKETAKSESKSERQFVSASLEQMLENITTDNKNLFHMKTDDDIEKILKPLNKRKSKTHTDYTDAIILFKIGNYYLGKIEGVKADNILNFEREYKVTTNKGKEYAIKIGNPLSYKHLTSFDDLPRLVKVQLEQNPCPYSTENNIIDDKLINEMITNHRQKNRQYAKTIFFVERDFLNKETDNTVIKINEKEHSEIIPDMDTETLFGRLKILRNSCFHNHILQGEKNKNVYKLEGYKQADNIFAEIAQEHKIKDWLQVVKENKTKNKKKYR